MNILVDASICFNLHRADVLILFLLSTPSWHVFFVSGENVSKRSYVLLLRIHIALHFSGELVFLVDFHFAFGLVHLSDIRYVSENAAGSMLAAFVHLPK